MARKRRQYSCGDALRGQVRDERTTAGVRRSSFEAGSLVQSDEVLRQGVCAEPSTLLRHEERCSCLLGSQRTSVDSKLFLQAVVDEHDAANIALSLMRTCHRPP